MKMGGENYQNFCNPEPLYYLVPKLNKVDHTPTAPFLEHNLF